MAPLRGCCVSYSTYNTLPESVRFSQALSFAKLLGYTPGKIYKDSEGNPLTFLSYFDYENYRSWVDVELSVGLSDGKVHVQTRTRFGRSYYDFQFQTSTARQIKRQFGGRLVEDGPEWFTPGPPFPPAASGCHLAVSRFDWHLNRLHIFRINSKFPTASPRQKASASLWPHMSELNPSIFMGNLIVPYLVSAMESFFKDTYIALLKHSPKKAIILKSARLGGEQLSAISDGRLSVEEAVAESMPFQRLSAVGRHFTEIDPKLDLLSVLRKPYRRRKRSLLQDLEDLTTERHKLIHDMRINSLSDLDKIDDTIQDLKDAVHRVHRFLTTYHSWPYEISSSEAERRVRKRRPSPEGSQTEAASGDVAGPAGREADEAGFEMTTGEQRAEAKSSDL